MPIIKNYGLRWARDKIRWTRAKPGDLPAEAAYIIVPRLHDNAELYGQSTFLATHQLGAISTSDKLWMGQIWNGLRFPDRGKIAA
jgi:hypothetical protein